MTRNGDLYPTQGDLAREQLRQRGVPYFSDVQEDVVRRLHRLPPLARAAFAASCAERLLRAHEQLPETDQRPFTLGWRPVLDATWLALTAGAAEMVQRVEHALADFHASPYDHSGGQEGPPDANEDAAAASICAAECLVTGDARAASDAAGRAVDAAFAAADAELQLDPNDFTWDPNGDLMPLAREAMHPAVQGELSRQLNDLALLEQQGVIPATLSVLRASSACD